MSGNKILVTGAGGFIGSHLVERLLQRGGFEVTCFYSKRQEANPPPARGGCKYRFGDINDPDAVAKAVFDQDIVVHLAGLVTNRSGNMMTVNVDGTRNVLEKCAELESPPVTILTSSLAAAGPTDGENLKTEADPAIPVSFYGNSKRAVELLGYEFADRIPVTVLRPPIVFGPRDSISFLLFRPIARFGVHVVPGRDELRVSLIHCADLVSAILRVIVSGQRLEPASDDEAQSTRGIYFVAARETPRFSDLGQMIGQSVGRDHVRILHAPYWAVKLTGMICESTSWVTGKVPFFNNDKAKEMTAGEWACSCDALTRDTQFRPEFSLADRLAQTAEWYFENGWLKRPRNFVPAELRLK